MLGGGSGALQLRQGPGEGSGEALAARGGGAGVAAGLQLVEGSLPQHLDDPVPERKVKHGL